MFLTRKLKKSAGRPKLKLLGNFIFVAIITLSLMGYQPIIAVPPVRQNIVSATFEQSQSIEAESFSQPLQLPHPGYLSTKYSTWHPGIDIATGLGMPVRPIIKGTIEDISFGFWGLGNYVVVTHEHNYRSTYAHMGRIFVKKGQGIDSSTILGEVGMSGWTTGPHTHLEISKEGKSIDPLTLLPNVPDIKAYSQEKKANK